MALLPSHLPAFDQLRYVRPDLRNFSEQAKRTKNHFQKWNKAENLREASLRFQRLVDGYNQAATLAQIRAAQRVGDPFYEEEVAFFQQVEPTVERLIASVQSWLRQSSSQPELRAFWGKAFFAHAEAARWSIHRGASEAWRHEQAELEVFLAATQVWNHPLHSAQTAPATPASPHLSEPQEVVAESASGLSEREQVAVYQAFYRLIEARRNLAASQGMTDYLAYAWLTQPRWEVSLEALRNLREQISRYLAPLARLILNPPEPTEAYKTLSETVEALTARESDFQRATWALEKVVGQGFKRSPQHLYQAMNQLFEADQGESDSGEWFLQWQQLGYLDLSKQPRGLEGVACFYLPKQRVPYLMGQLQASPYFLHDLLRELGRAYAFLKAGEHQHFTPFVEMGVAGGECIGQTFALLSLSRLAPLLGEHTALFHQWSLRHLLLTLLETVFLDAFQDAAYQAAQSAEALEPIWQQQAQRFFPGVAPSALRLPDLATYLLRGDLAMAPFYTADRFVAQMAAFLFWERHRQQADPQETYRAWQALCACGSRDPLLDRLHHLGWTNPFDLGALKKLAYQLCYEMGF